MIDKGKLIQKFKELELPHSASIVENFPEEPEIDFDVLFVEWINSHCDNISNGCGINPVETASCFKDFLKSKHLTAPKPKQIPVKKYWTLKKEYEDFCSEFLIQSVKTVLNNVEPVSLLAQYYDYHEEPDYSKIPVGAYIVVKFKEFNRSKCGVVCQHYRDFFNIDTGDNQHSVPYNGDGVESIEILKMPEHVENEQDT